ncbi:FkbM family methyltransferase [Rhizobium sp. CC1099]|uniref:FkbM family methyltransferase n=1 Tax=Rhizobium sp. CC1099 TaxID=3039160 RepID=UPI0024B2855D|nr:FkbM family methyltransferase [Rhizobium sp. CC1099]WFU86308.1 FkbM family methyltransferase [Rhizobium sp. CC1099]
MGEPSAYETAVRRLHDRGYKIEALVADDGERSDIRGVPIVNRATYPLRPGLPVVFAGVPRKFQFSTCRQFCQALFWLDADLVPKQKSRLADPKILARNTGDISRMYGLLQDEESKATMRSILASRLFNDNGYLRIAKYREYDHPFVKVTPGDVVVDAGAHVGKITRMFAKACGPNGQVYSFEPDPENFKEMADRNSDLHQVEPVKLGVWSSTTTLSFNNDQGPSAGHALTENGGLKVPVVSLDEFFSQPGRRPPTLIKLDIEGAEAAALSGAEKTIRTYKPRLMISAYHKPHDLWELLFQVQALRPDYQFYLGHHNFYHTETDVYAV